MLVRFAGNNGGFYTVILIYVVEYVICKVC